jgi:hypothetical protein
MSLTDRELWTAMHGVVLGAAFLLAFTGGLAGLYGLRHDWLCGGGSASLVPRAHAQSPFVL